jgi:hypothetical protein
MHRRASLNARSSITITQGALTGPNIYFINTLNRIVYLTSTDARDDYHSPFQELR